MPRYETREKRKKKKNNRAERDVRVCQIGRKREKKPTHRRGSLSHKLTPRFEPLSMHRTYSRSGSFLGVTAFMEPDTLIADSNFHIGHLEAHADFNGQLKLKIQT